MLVQGPLRPDVPPYELRPWIPFGTARSPWSVAGSVQGSVRDWMTWKPWKVDYAENWSIVFVALDFYSELRAKLWDLGKG